MPHTGCAPACALFALPDVHVLTVEHGLASTTLTIETAQDLYLSVPTVKTHIGRIFTKLGIDNRVQLAIKVLESRQKTTSK